MSETKQVEWDECQHSKLPLSGVQTPEMPRKCLIRKEDQSTMLVEKECSTEGWMLCYDDVAVTCPQNVRHKK